MTDQPPEGEGATDKTDLARAVTALYAVDERMRDIAKAQKRSKAQVRVLAISVALDVILSVGLFVSINRTNDAVDHIDRNSAAIRASCEARNDADAKQVKLWDGILALPRAPGTPPQDPKVLAQFRSLLKDAYPVRDCVKVAGG